MQALALLPLAAALAIGPSQGPYHSQTNAEYRQAVQETYNLVSSAGPNDNEVAQQALATLKAGTGQTQPEVIADLTRKPPDFEDARDRLRALLDALAAPAATNDPARAQEQLHQVLSMHRYDQLRQPPGPLERLSQWVSDRIAGLIRLLFGGGGGGSTIPALYFYVTGAIVIAVVAFLVFRSARGRFGESFTRTGHIGPLAPADFFAEADRLAAAGDYRAAIRLLCAGVAATLAGERTWEGSPLTVREIFKRAPEPDRLDALLLPFEAAIYGGRDVNRATYARAAEAAAPFRAPREAAA